MHIAPLPSTENWRCKSLLRPALKTVRKLQCIGDSVGRVGEKVYKWCQNTWFPSCLPQQIFYECSGVFSCSVMCHIYIYMLIGTLFSHSHLNGKLCPS